MKTTYLSGADIVSIIEKIGLDKFMDVTIDTVEKSFVEYARGTIDILPRPGLYLKNGLVEIMPAISSNIKEVCVKIVSYYGNNCRMYNLPSVIGTTIMLDKETGFPCLLADATLLTDIRTGAASAVATKYLARKNSQTIGIIGNGSQAITQIHALSRVVRVEKVFAYDKNNERSRNFAEYIVPLIKKEVEIVPPKTLCQNSDIIVTATPTRRSEPPVVEQKWVQQGTHINAIGADDPGKTELDVNLVRNAKVIPDFYKQARTSGECQGLLGSEIYAELGDIIIGKKQGRENDNEITIFDSTGTAFEDLFVFEEVIALGKKLKIGSDIKSIEIPPQPYNPYSVF